MVGQIVGCGNIVNNAINRQFNSWLYYDWINPGRERNRLINRRSNGSNISRRGMNVMKFWGSGSQCLGSEKKPEEII